MTDTSTGAVIGAGPSGVAAARNLQRFDLPWTRDELADRVGGTAAQVCRGAALLDQGPEGGAEASEMVAMTPYLRRRASW